MTSGNLAGRAALITGGGTGLGLASALRLAADGAAVTLAGRSEAKLAAGLAAIEAAVPGADVRVVTCDVTDEDSVAAAVAAANADGTLALCVANAGTGAGGAFGATTLESWNHVMTTNLTGTFLTFKHASNAIAANGGGSMVAISSIAAVLTHRFMTAYCVSKAAIDMLVRNVADELGPQNVRVNGVRPGLVPTDISTGLMSSNAIRADYLSQMPLGRVGTTDDIAAMVRFLLGDESAWITGQVIGVDGGHALRRGPNLDAPEPPALIFE